METDVLEKLAKVLSSRGRKQVAEKNFAMPASAAKSGKNQRGSYPIHDLEHARSALSYGKRFLSADEYSKLQARVYAKYPSLKKNSTKGAMMITGEQARALYKKATLGGTSYADVMKARDASNVEQNRLMPGVTNLFGAPTGAVDSTATSTLARGMGSPASGPAAPAKVFFDRMLQAARTKAQPKRVNGRRMSYREPMTQANRNQKYIGR